jgi:RNA polymerase sigma factor (sigma-70 family)
MVSAFPPSFSNDPDPPNPNAADLPRLEDIWDQFYAYCIAIISRCPGVRRLSVADREDCVQDVMMVIVRRFGTAQVGHRPDHFDAWLRLVARNKAADLVRRRKRKPMDAFQDGSGETLLDPVNPESKVTQPEYISLVWEALLTLDKEISATSYLVFYLRSIEGWPVPEIAELFQLSTEQTRARCHRAKKKFEEILKERSGDIGS